MSKLSRPINLAIVDNQTIFRKTLKNYLTEYKNINVVVQAHDMRSLLCQLKHARIDILVMDLFMQSLNGHEAVKSIRQECQEIRILVLSMCTDLYLISELLDLGIHGYISKTDEPEELLQAIISASNDRIYRNQIFTEALYWNKQDSIARDIDATMNCLNEREKKILQFLWEEKSNKEIADQLFLSIRSVEKIRQDMKEKIGVRSTVGLLKYGIKQKIV